MAQRTGTNPAVKRTPGNGDLTIEESIELPDTVPGLTPDASRREPTLRGTTGSGESDQDRGSQSENIEQIQEKVRKMPSGRAKEEAQGWVDEEYKKSNPWYGRTSKKPVYSLGKPLPRTVRWSGKKADAPIITGAPTKSPEDLAELGEVESNATGSADVARQTSAAESEHSKARRTAAGAAHNARRNDVGQPVFEYLPGDDKLARRERTNETHDTIKSNKEIAHAYGIDSEPLGQREDEDVEQGDKDPDEMRNWWARVRAKHPEPLAEFLATGIAVFMGLGATLSVNLSADQAVKYGSYETSCWAWGFAWMFGIYLGGGVSGAHMNPAISISLSLFRGFPWRSCAIYVLVQFIASIVAGALAFGIYRDTIMHVDPTMANTAKTFFSSPQEWVSMGTAFFDQVVGSAIMMLAVFALGDDQNNPPGAGMHALVLGLLLTTLKFTLGYNIGSALNPASDFGPRLVAWAVGYRGPEVFQTGWWFYGPWLATLVGSFIGCALYDGFIFVGSESPINYRRIKGEDVKKRTRRFFNFTMKK
ncbi:aquaporin-like protein [Hypoxylon sp. NC1633]|nr:aquaporin-like protein [Hypoxylon sp. NC1633]